MDFRSLFAGPDDFREDSFLLKDQSGDDLPDLGTLFSVPPLPDNPQNPIMDTLDRAETSRTLPSPRILTDAFPEEHAVIAATYVDPLLDRPLDVYELWNDDSLLKHRSKVSIYGISCPCPLLMATRIKHCSGTECVQIFHRIGHLLRPSFPSRTIWCIGLLDISKAVLLICTSCRWTLIDYRLCHLTTKQKEYT